MIAKPAKIARTANPVVPCIAMWSEETVSDPQLVVWDHATINPGRGKPRFARIHVHRQRRAMRKLLCQVCGGPADHDRDGVLWLLPDRTRDWPDWPEGMLVAEPPICHPCAHLATRTCPALRAEGHHLIRARAHPVYGVDGFRYRRGPHSPVAVESEPVAFTDPAVRWIPASKLVRMLRACTVVEKNPPYSAGASDIGP
ncbi:hypothetical protein [Saccharothrix syringae]|uniref:Uncharacterized protein n=1 Tax=Saccharothrix syringae TaxID=103733 RepID=A0A5Q0GUV3_SACSY|nr:hypothetical protein [Saccharothrix syringae]QFZ17405.1 hypothetical protein EKG83_07885 [Saccharothrix syringae]